MPPPRRRPAEPVVVPPPVYIAGTGLVTVQGLSVSENWQNLLAGRVLHETGIVPLARDPALPRVSQLAIHAAREAHAAAGAPPLDDGRTALVIGTSKGPIEDWIDQLDGRRAPNLSLGLAQVAADVATALGHCHGPRLTYAGACASGLHALGRAYDLMTSGQCDRALVVAAEASTHALFRANFARLGVLAEPSEGCRPFDVGRRGFLLAEAAAAVVVCTTPPDASSVEVARIACLADAAHLTAPDPAGRALRRALETVGIDGVSFVHAHGTGTPHNDAAELAAIATVCERHPPTIYSHKHAIGHTQGAAGLIGVVLNERVHRAGTAPGNANTRAAEPSPLMIPSTVSALRVRQSLVIAAGFGGTLAAARLSSDI